MQSFCMETHVTNVMQVRLFDTSGKEIQSEADARARVVNRATLFVSSGESCNRPLHYAAVGGHTSIVRLLISR
jgi:hypothetical protein